MPQETSEGFYLHHLPRFALLQDFLPGATVLLLGAGGHYDAEILLSLGAGRVISVSAEPTDDHHPVGDGTRLEEGATFLQAEYHRLPFADHQFDIIFAFEALNGHPQLSRAVAELKRVLSPEGFIAIAAPNFARDDLREAMGEGERRYTYRSPAELYEALLERFEHITPLAQAPFLGYTLLEHNDSDEPRPFNISYDLLGGRAEAPLFHFFLASDLEIVLEEDRLIQVPFSHLVDRIQEGLRLFHRSLERKNSALLELREELALLRRDTDLQRDTANRLRQQVQRLVDRLQTITRDIDPLLHSPAEGAREVVDGVRRLRERVSDLLAGVDPEQGSRPLGAGASVGSMSFDEGRLLAEGLRGQGIDDQLRRIEGATASDLRLPQGRSAVRAPAVPIYPEDPIFQEDLAPFRLPGPVALSTALRQDLAETRQQLHQREAEMRQLLQWRDGLLGQVTQLEDDLRRTLGSGPNNWQLRQAVTRLLEALTGLLQEPALEDIQLPVGGSRAIPAPASDEATGRMQGDQAELFNALMALHTEEAEAGAAGTGPDRERWEAEMRALRDRAGELEARIEALQQEAEALRTREHAAEQLEARVQEVDARAAELALWEESLAAREQALEGAQAGGYGEARSAAYEEPVEEDITEERPIPAPEEMLETREEAISARLAELAVLEEALAAREQALEERERALGEEREVTAPRISREREEALAALEGALDDRDRSIADRERALEAREAAMFAREEALASGFTALASRQDELAALDEMLQSRAALLDARERELTSRTAELEAQTNRLETRGREIEAQARELTSRESQATGLIQQREALIIALESDLGALEIRVRDAERRARDAALRQSSSDADRAAREQMQAELEQARTDLEQARTDLEQARTDLEQARATAAGLQTDLEQARTDQSRLQAELESARSSAETATNQAGQAELEALRATQAEAEQTLTRLREELAAAKQAEAERTEANAELEAKIQALYSQRETLEAEVAQARSQAAHQMQAAAGLDVLQTELEELRGQLARQQTELETLRAHREAAGELEASLASLQEKLAAQEASVTHALEEARTATTRREELEKLYTEREAEIAELKEEVQRAWKRSLESGGDLAGVEQTAVESIAAVAEPMSDLQAQLESQRDQLDKLQKQLDSRNILLTRLQKELELKSTHNRNLQEIIGKQREDLDKIKGKIREAIEYIGRLHQANQEKDQELDHLRKQLGRNDNPPMHS